MICEVHDIGIAVQRASASCADYERVEAGTPRLLRRSRTAVCEFICADLSLGRGAGCQVNLLLTSETRTNTELEIKRSTTETAATVGLISKRMPFHICTGKVTARLPARNSETTTSSKEVRNAKKAPTKKAPAKKAPAKAAKKAPAKQPSPAKKAPAKEAAPAGQAAEPAPKLADTNGSSAAKETAAQAKSTVTTAVPPTLVPQPGPERYNMPIAAAIAAGVLAILVVLLSRRGSADD